jgi:hypothetical protein
MENGLRSTEKGYMENWLRRTTESPTRNSYMDNGYTINRYTDNLMQQLIQPLPRSVTRAEYLDEARHNKNREENLE